VALLAESTDDLAPLLNRELAAIHVQRGRDLAGLVVVLDPDHVYAELDADLRGDPCSVVTVECATVLIANNRDEDTEALDPLPQRRLGRGVERRKEVRQVAHAASPSGQTAGRSSSEGLTSRTARRALNVRCRVKSSATSVPVLTASTAREPSAAKYEATCG